MDSGLDASRRPGMTSVENCPRSDWTAASGIPGKSVGADPGARHHHNRGRGDHDRALDDDDAAIRTASAIGTAMEAEAASAGGIGGAKTRDRAGNQNCCEKGLHVSSVFVWAAPRHLTMIQAV
jgi:hypothetical protein